MYTVCPALVITGDVGTKQTKRNPHTDELCCSVSGKIHNKQNKCEKINRPCWLMGSIAKKNYVGKGEKCE